MSVLITADTADGESLTFMRKSPGHKSRSRLNRSEEWEFAGQGAALNLSTRKVS